MSAFGKRGGVGGARPNFGVAKPMKGGPAGSAMGGEQFPPIDELTPPVEAPVADHGGAPMGAMDRLTARQNASG